MTRDQLVERYPLLWHMADPRNIKGIFARGLLSTKALLDLYEVTGVERRMIESERRPESVPLSSRTYGASIIRDQKPIIVSKIEKSIKDATLPQFLRFLNGRVFFWPTTKKLATMNNARAYRDDNQLVFVVKTESLVTAHARRIRISPINSGATIPMAHDRSIGMFKTIPQFDYEARKKCADLFAELTVADAVPDIIDHVERLEVWRGGALQKVLARPYNATSIARQMP